MVAAKGFTAGHPAAVHGGISPAFDAPLPQGPRGRESGDSASHGRRSQQNHEKRLYRACNGLGRIVAFWVT